jgi:hypothetical protein
MGAKWRLKTEKGKKWGTNRKQKLLYGVVQASYDVNKEEINIHMRGPGIMGDW